VKILFIEWESYGYQDIKEAFAEEGHQLICFPFQVFGHQGEELLQDPETEDRLCAVLHREVPDVLFSVDYYPVISRVCQKEGIRYLSYSYDCPHILLYSETIKNSCNTAYVFDKKTCQEYRREGISTVHYLPLAANTERLDAMDRKLPDRPSFAYDVSFVGSLYLEKGNYFDQIEPLLPEYTRGYLKALIAVQMGLQGCDLVREMMRPMLNDLYRAYPVGAMRDSLEPAGYFYEQFMIKRRITAIERLELLEAVSEKYGADLFTHMQDFSMENLRNHGSVEYLHEMPLVFKQSRINLNITLRSIGSGIPLRAFDIMGAGGFLLSNYQADFLDHFVPGEDFVYYENKEDLLRKIDYYLRHENERKNIAQNGHDKVAAKHTYRHRVREMLDFEHGRA